ncbi:unnamed protein product [Pleuronectes platessa]|uniref:Uncharacterized protein n=1 Tax=Pleuronectes platessa TaxID=8262 RepID=A0A9N7Z166_PLEPL|nr:unnamed protein product [Pleuronectes platessa]
MHLERIYYQFTGLIGRTSERFLKKHLSTDLITKTTLGIRAVPSVCRSSGCARLGSESGVCVCWTVTLTPTSPFFLVLCIALRKCSTPHSACSSSSKGGCCEAPLDYSSRASYSRGAQLEERLFLL